MHREAKVKIYAAADIHAKPSRLAALRDRLERIAADIFVAAGDTFHYTADPMVVDALDLLPAPVVAVKGNTDSTAAMRLLGRAANVCCLHMESICVSGTDFVGIGGTLPLPFRSLLAWREKPLTASVSGLVGPETVLVVHPPPFGVRDRVFNRFPAGSRGLRNLVTACRPKVVVCGHVHEQAGFDTLGATLVVNCSMGRGGMGALIRLSPGQRPRAEML